jgi:hypothetical protein
MLRQFILNRLTYYYYFNFDLLSRSAIVEGNPLITILFLDRFSSQQGLETCCSAS